MKKVVILVLGVVFAATVLEACSNKICPAYRSYPEGRRGR